MHPWTAAACEFELSGREGSFFVASSAAQTYKANHEFFG
jgi:hypothetical protein